MFTKRYRSQVKQYQGKDFWLRQIKEFSTFRQLSFDYLIGWSYKATGLGMISQWTCCNIGHHLLTWCRICLVEWAPQFLWGSQENASWGISVTAAAVAFQHGDALPSENTRKHCSLWKGCSWINTHFPNHKPLVSYSLFIKRFPYFSYPFVIEI